MADLPSSFLRAEVSWHDHPVTIPFCEAEEERVASLLQEADKMFSTFTLWHEENPEACFLDADDLEAVCADIDALSAALRSLLQRIVEG